MDENDDEGPFNTSTIILYTGVGESTHSFEWDDINLREKTINNSRTTVNFSYQNNYWALLALILVLGTAAGNILVCLAIVWERRLQNVTNYFLMSLAMTDLMVAILVMPLGILTLVRGYFPLQSVHCLVWICLDVLFCTASIMHLCTISVDRYLSLRYPMKFGRNKTRRRVTLKIIFVWLLSIAMSLPLSLMYSKDHASVLVNGTCQIPDPVYKLVGSIVCFYIPLCVMLITYCLTVQLLARQRQNLGGAYHQPTGWASGWLGQGSALERRCTWRKLLKTGLPQGQNHAHSATSTETELSTLDTHELWLPDSSIPDPTPSTMTALHQFGAEMLKLSRGLESVATTVSSSSHSTMANNQYSVAQEGEEFQMHTSRDQNLRKRRLNRHSIELDHKLHIEADSPSSEAYSLTSFAKKSWKRRSSAAATPSDKKLEPLLQMRKRYNSLPRNALGPVKNDNDRTSSDSRSDTKCSTSVTDDRKSRSDSEASKKDSYLELPPPCTCPYFGDRPLKNSLQPTEVKIISTGLRSPTSLLDPDVITIPTSSMGSLPEDTPTTRSSPQKSPNYLPIALPPVRKLSYSKTTSVVTWDATRNKRRGSSFGGVRTSLLLTPTKIPPPGVPLRRSATLRNHNNIKFTNSDSGSLRTSKIPSSPCLLQRTTTIRSHHSRNSSVISRNSSRHGRIIRLEQKATKVLGVVFFTFVILWAPFFVLNLLPTVCRECEERISHWVFDVVTWLGYASSMVNPIFYTIFNKVFRQAFKNVLMCKYGTNIGWRPNR